MHILWHAFQVHPYLVVGGVVSAGTILLGAIFKAFETVFEAFTEFVLGLFFVRKELDDLYTLRIITDYFNKEGRGYGISTERYEANYKHIRTVEGYRNVFYRMHWGTWRVWLFHRRPVLLIPSDGGGDEKPTICFFRGTLDWERVCIDAAALRDERLVNFKDTARRFKIRRHFGSNKLMAVAMKAGESGPDPETKSQEKHKAIAADVGDPLFWSRDEIGPPAPDNPLEMLSINPSMQRVIDDVRFWFTHQAWYRKKGIMWKLCIMLFGLPGVGKTSIVRALGEELDLPIHTFNLASMDDADLIHAWEESQRDAPRINLFEDLDTVFHGRENIVKDSKLSFQTVLNIIDGVERENGLLFFVTTNHVEEMDVALGRPSTEITTDEGDPMSSRPGRIDLAVELLGIDAAGRRKIAERILDDKELAIFMAETYSTDSAAQFQERCRQKAKRQLWATAPS